MRVRVRVRVVVMGEGYGYGYGYGEGYGLLLGSVQHFLVPTPTCHFSLPTSGFSLLGDSSAAV